MTTRDVVLGKESKHTRLAAAPLRASGWGARFVRAATVVILILPAFAIDSQLPALIAQGDVEDRQRHTRAALADFEQAEKLDPKNVAVLLRLSKQHLDLVTDAKSAADEKHAQHALDYAQRAVALDPKSAKAHLTIAIAHGKLTDFVGNKTKLEFSKVIKAEAECSLALDASDDFAWHVLGRWHFGVANVSPVLRALARMVYGGLPRASNEEAARCLEKATKLAPQRIMHHSELARIYTAMEKPELAAKEWRAVLALPAADDEDKRDHHEARQALGRN